MSKPSLSVVLPTFNRAHLIGRAIQSVLCQSYRDFELIVVDDGSNDGTDEVVNSIDDSRLRYLRHDTNKGGNAARNTGVKAARAPYVAFQDSDDEWLLDKLEKQMALFEKCSRDVVAVYCGSVRFDKGRTSYLPDFSIRNKEGQILKNLLRGNFVTTQTLIVRYGSIEEAGYFDPELRRLQEWDLVIRLANLGEFRFLDEPLVMIPCDSPTVFRAMSLHIWPL